jgi:hypothetical protein
MGAPAEVDRISSCETRRAIVSRLSRDEVGSHGNEGDVWWIEYDLPGGGCLALTNFTEKKPSASAGGTIAFEVEDLDTLIADLESKQLCRRLALCGRQPVLALRAIGLRLLHPCRQRQRRQVEISGHLGDRLAFVEHQRTTPRCTHP